MVKFKGFSIITWILASLSVSMFFISGIALAMSVGVEDSNYTLIELLIWLLIFIISFFGLFTKEIGKLLNYLANETC